MTQDPAPWPNVVQLGNSASINGNGFEIDWRGCALLKKPNGCQQDMDHVLRLHAADNHEELISRL